MNILQPPYVYSPTMAKCKHFVGEIVLWIVGVPLLALPVLVILGFLGLAFWAIAMSTWGWPQAFYLSMAVLVLSFVCLVRISRPRRTDL